MKCPNCGNVFLMGNTCPKCGIDVVLFEKTIKISDVLYNKGLSLAKVRDLWGAQEALTKSIQFNKNNYYARNLLGLVYYETGRIGDALKHWVISSSLVQQDNPAIRYINYFQQEGKSIDLYNDAIKMYNQALVYIQQKSDDMAIIQLKKALEINPDFIDAMNLLSFCYLIQNDKERAVEYVDHVLELDINNPIALNYYNEIHDSERRPKHLDRDSEPRQPAQFTGTGANKITPEDAKRGFGTNFYFAEVMSFLIGGACTLLLFLTLIIPNMLRERDNTISELESTLETERTAFAEQESDYQSTIAEMEGNLENYGSIVADYNLQAEIQENISSIDTAEALYNSGEYEEAAQIIKRIENADRLPEEAYNKYEAVKDQAYSEASQVIFNRGVREYEAREYTDATNSFTQCLDYLGEDSNLRDDVVFYFAEIARAEGDNEAAIRFYQNLIDNFPNSNRLSAAQTELDRLQSE